MKRYKKKTIFVGGTAIVTDVPNTKGEVHLCQCLEYLCAYNPKYHEPPKELEPDAWWVKWAENRKKRQGQSGPAYVNLGPMGDRNESAVGYASPGDW
jgi:hypothetical protein